MPSARLTRLTATTALGSLIALLGMPPAIEARPGGDALAQGLRDDIPLPDLSDQLAPLRGPSLPVTVKISPFRISNPDEDGMLSNGDEPYLFVAAIFVDGTTVDTANLPGSSVRILSPSKTHGNLGIEKVDKGTYPIPNSTGLFKATIRPIANVSNLNLAKNLAMVGLIVIAMDEDGTPTSAMNKARQAFVSTLQAELDKSVRKTSPPDVQQLTQKVKNAMIKAVTKELMSSPGGFLWGLPGVADPDDFIGADFKIVTYSQIEAAGATGIPIAMSFKNSGVRYSLSGRIGSP